MIVLAPFGITAIPVKVAFLIAEGRWWIFQSSFQFGKLKGAGSNPQGKQQLLLWRTLYLPGLERMFLFLLKKWTIVAFPSSKDRLQVLSEVWTCCRSSQIYFVRSTACNQFGKGGKNKRDSSKSFHKNSWEFQKLEGNSLKIWRQKWTLQMSGPMHHAIDESGLTRIKDSL